MSGCYENVVIRCKSGSAKSFSRITIDGFAFLLFSGNEIRLNLPVGTTDIMMALADGYFTRNIFPFFFVKRRKKKCSIQIPDGKTAALVTITVERFAKDVDIQYLPKSELPAEIIEPAESKDLYCSVCGSKSIKTYSGYNNLQLCGKCKTVRDLLTDKKNDEASRIGAEYFVGYIRRHPEREVNATISEMLQKMRTEGFVGLPAAQVIEDFVNNKEPNPNMEEVDTSENMPDNVVSSYSEISEESKDNPNINPENRMENTQQPIIQETVTKRDDSEKGSSRKALTIIGNILSGILGLIAAIVGFGALFGLFDKNPIPCFIFIAVDGLFTWLGNKFSKVPTIVFSGIEIVLLVIILCIGNNAGAVASVKNGSPDGYQGATYGEAFEYYFSDPTWKKLGKNEDGNVVVKFTGTCLYMDQPAIAQIKFTIYKNQGKFVVSSVKINDQDMGIFGNALVLDVFEEYSERDVKKKADDISVLINAIEGEGEDNNISAEETKQEAINEEPSSEPVTEPEPEPEPEDIMIKFGYNAGQYDSYAFIRDLLAVIDEHTECHSMEDIRNYLVDRGWYTDRDLEKFSDEIICHKFMWYYRADGLPGYLPQWFDSNGRLTGGVPIYFVVVSAPDGYVNLREGASTQYNIVTPIYNGSYLRVYEESSDRKWLHVTMEDYEGWVAASQVTIL